MALAGMAPTGADDAFSVPRQAKTNLMASGAIFDMPRHLADNDGITHRLDGTRHNVDVR